MIASSLLSFGGGNAPGFFPAMTKHTVFCLSPCFRFECDRHPANAPDDDAKVVFERFQDVCGKFLPEDDSAIEETAS